MIKLLILSAGTNASYHVAKTIKEKFPSNFNIVGADINERHLIATSPYLDSFHKVPYSKEPKYYETILDICREDKIDYILPSLDIDQFLFYPENDDLLSLGVQSLSTSKKVLNVYKDKDQMHAFLLKHNFLVPKQYSAQDIQEDQSYFIKPKTGFASIGAKRIIGKEIFDLPNMDDYVIQEVCSNPEYTLECFNYKKRFTSVVRERIATKAGVCVKTKIYSCKELENIAHRFATELEAPLYFNLQFMKNNNYEYVITDVNLRLAGGMSLSCAGGWDEASALAEVMQEKSQESIFSHLTLNTPVQYIIRAYTDIVTQQKLGVIAIDLDGTLLNSANRHQIVLDSVLKKYQLNVNTSNLNEFKNSGHNNIEFLKNNGVSESLAKEMQSQWIEHIEDEIYLATDVLYKDTLHFLEKLSSNYELILLTARKNKIGTEKQISNLRLNKFFKKIIIVSDAKLKSAALSENNVQLMIGDTETDWSAAVNAGIAFKMLNRGFRNKEFWDIKGISSFDSLSKIII